MRQSFKDIRHFESSDIALFCLDGAKVELMVLEPEIFALETESMTQYLM